ncbi:MAG: transcription elongation factor GreA [Ruminococcaceae bacterium]|nr:transcription elongation factor GreA [Oscillospiraceae bacterium]
MHDELTAMDLKKMQEELDYRVEKLMPELIEEVKRTRAFGDLSENAEYKLAKQAQNRNRSRIRYLERMIASARVIEDRSAADEVGLYDKVELWLPEDQETEVIRVVTTVRCDPLKGLVSKESPLGLAVLGRKVGDRMMVKINDQISYEVEIRSIEKGDDDGSTPLLKY